MSDWTAPSIIRRLRQAPRSSTTSSRRLRRTQAVCTAAKRMRSCDIGTMIILIGLRRNTPLRWRAGTSLNGSSRCYFLGDHPAWSIAAVHGEAKHNALAFGAVRRRTPDVRSCHIADIPGITAVERGADLHAQERSRGYDHPTAPGYPMRRFVCGVNRNQRTLFRSAWTSGSTRAIPSA